MNPLINKFFLEELTDQEESILETELTQSEDAAWDFGQAAEAAYQRYGLPEPELPGDSGGQGSTGGTRPWVWVPPLLGLVLLMAFVIWKALGPGQPVKQEMPPVKEMPVPVKKLIKKVVLPPAVKKEAMKAPESQVETPPQGGVLKEAGNNLKVVVKRETAGPALVRVVNSLGVEIRRMFMGNLQAGRWSFEWDGRSGDGKLVDPGKYYIQVQTEGTTQSREVNIR